MDRLPPTGHPVHPSAAPQPEFGAELRRLRTERGLSLSALSRLLHYSKGYLSKIENGGKPAGPDLARRCDALLDAQGALLRLADPVADAEVAPTVPVPPVPMHPVPVPPAPVPPAPMVLVPGAPSGAVPAEPDLPCPYLGLAAFGPQDARWFAGRASALAALLDRLAERAGHGPLALVAPSGAGKSSLLRAGLLPALRRGELPVTEPGPRRAVVCTPTAHPLAELRRVLAGASANAPINTSTGGSTGAPTNAPTNAPTGGEQARSGLVLVVDQFEEVFTLCQDPVERQAFIQALCALATSTDRAPALVVLGVRADFCGRCLDHPDLVPVLSRGLLALGPMSATELREAITAPAVAAGLLLEPGLVEVLLRDLGLAGVPHQGGSPEESDALGAAPLRAGPAGVLPLLSHALLATWQQREGRTLTVAGYLRTGGVQGAIAATAENLFAGLTGEGRQAARQLLLRLVHVGEESEATRRPVPLDQLRGPGGTGNPAAPVLDAFVQARLLTVDSQTVLITHEALLRAWPRLRGWLQADRAGLLVRQQLAEAAAEWERTRHDPALLYRGSRLATAVEHLHDPRRRAELTPGEVEFLTAGHQQEAERQRTARRQARRRRQLLVTLAVLLVLAVTASATAYRQRAAAFAERRTALSKALAAESAGLAAGRPEASMLLADEAFRTAPTTEARGALLSTQSQAFAGRLFGHTGPVNAVAFSPDSTRLATASSDGTLKLWQPADRRLDTTLTGHGGPVRAVAFSPDGRTLASGSSDGTARLWDLTGRQLPVTLFGNGGGVRSVAFSPDGRTLASGGADRAVRLWDTTSHTLLATLTGHSDEVLGLAFSPDGHTLASASADHDIRLWDTIGDRLLGALTGHSDEVLGVAFSPDGHTLASASADRTVRLWDTTSHTLLTTLTGHSDDVNGVAYTDGGATLVSASGDGTVRLWDLATRRITATLCGHTDYVQGVAVSPDGAVIATAGFDQTAALWRPGASALTAHPFTEIWQSAISPDGRTVAAADAAHTVRLWDVARHRPAGTLGGHSGSVFGVAFSPDGRLLASAGADQTVRLWDLASGSQLAVLSGHQGSVFAVAFSPDGQLLASAGEDRTVRLWDVRTRRPVGVLSGHTDFVNAVAFSPDGRRLASGSDDLTVRLWDVADRRLATTLTGHTGAVRAVAFAPDGRTLASAGNDGTVRTWDTHDHAPGAIPTAIATLTGHTGSVRGIAFAPDSRTLASAGNDGTVRTWDTRDRTLTATLTGHTDAVWSVSFSPDGRTLASSGSDGTVRLWNASTEDRAAEICRLLGVVSPEQWARLLPDQPYRPGC
ncbi:helix-turn-helix domain-containing protein [Kitasatospora sp. NBC_01287]|uniref:nSTAND1 domain-containing NTPase n=1 Tax=Kitasatospora sp. NBC_01287 TaxID=2903573 RepID=UPI00224EEDDB|nr:helix-turn-helix domain-containing protein [Kitasatospora sp. NBC_01287]MCX4744565.1 helix-turn-helix domain-containing protein [Kitasatospora sp. NBC_01287]